MPSPFPGMDPYLEDPIVWPGFHTGLIYNIATVLNAHFSVKYVATIGQRLFIVQHQRNIYPDLAAVERPPNHPGPVTRSAAATATLESDPPLVLRVEPVTVRQAYVEVRRAGHAGRVITTIEVLSPSNKAAGTDTREQYLRKQDELLASSVSLLEIDLLRQGRYTLAAPESLLEAAQPRHYLVSLHRAGPDGQFEVWPVSLTNRLPRVRVPLADGDPDTVLDLQAAFDRCYDDTRLGHDVDYAGEPALPLAAADGAWADALLRERGLRS